jgi:hypothetical protein
VSISQRAYWVIRRGEASEWRVESGVCRELRTELKRGTWAEWNMAVDERERFTYGK